jgi:hypothetical protein
MKAQDLETKKKFLVSFLRAFQRSLSEATNPRGEDPPPNFQ